MKARAVNAGSTLAAAVLLAAGVPAPVPAQFPDRPPPAAPLKPVQFPPFREVVLPNGLRVVVVEHHEQPVVSASLSFRAGSAFDPTGKEGVAAFTAELLTKGTPTRTAEQIAAAIEGVGGSLDASADRDFFTVSTSALSDHVELAFELMGDVVRRATFPAEELELARTRMVSALQLELSQPEALAGRFFAREIYGSHPYGRLTSTDSYRAVTRDDVSRFAARRLRPSGALLVVAGDVTLPRVRQLLARHFAGWQGAPPGPVAPAAAPARRTTDILLVHRPGSAQANIVVGNTTFGPADTGYYAARLAMHALGGGADSRLFLLLREQKGWTYGAYAGLQRYRGLGHWEGTAETRTEVADSALAELLAQLDRIRTQAVPDSELGNAKGFLVGSFPLSIETPEQIAGQVARTKLLGLGDNYLRLYRERLSAVTPPRARAAAARVIRRNGLSIVVVGDGAKLYDRLKAIAPVRLMDSDGKPLAPADLSPVARALALDASQLVARTDSFRVLVQGNPFGSQTGTLRRTADSLVYDETMSLGPMGQQQTTVVFDARDLSVRQVDQTSTFGPQRGEVHLRYAEGRVQGSAVVPQPGGQPKSFTVDTAVAPGTYDDNALPVIIPALPLAAGQTFTVNVFASGEGAAKVYTLKANAPESVTVPAGTFQAFRVDVTGGRAPVQIFVSTETPRRVLKIAPVGTPLVLELLK
jgi:zinc protease